VNRNRLILMAAVCLAWAAPMARGADKPIEGAKVILRDPVDVTQRRFNFLSKDPNITYGSNGDSDTPSTNGAALLLFNPVSSECQCIVLSSLGFTIGGEGKRLLYRDPAVAVTPVKLVMMKAGKLKILARGAALTGVTLDETQQDEIAVHYTSGTGSRLCADFTTPSIHVNQPGAFIALNAAAPAACLPEPAACTPCVPPIVP
jgi:hypothetical protein